MTSQKIMSTVRVHYPYMLMTSHGTGLVNWYQSNWWLRRFVGATTLNWSAPVMGKASGGTNNIQSCIAFSFYSTFSFCASFKRRMRDSSCFSAGHFCRFATSSFSQSPWSLGYNISCSFVPWLLIKMPCNTHWSLSVRRRLPWRNITENNLWDKKIIISHLDSLPHIQAQTPGYPFIHTHIHSHTHAGS